jgi:hypothetical protein
MIVQDADRHLYGIGQVVRLAPHAGLHTQAAGAYEVLATMPERGGTLQYRVKSMNESHARVVSENDIADLWSASR